jgi:hypothetical protein
VFEPGTSPQLSHAVGEVHAVTLLIERARRTSDRTRRIFFMTKFLG